MFCRLTPGVTFHALLVEIDNTTGYGARALVDQVLAGLVDEPYVGLRVNDPRDVCVYDREPPPPCIL